MNGSDLGLVPLGGAKFLEQARQSRFGSSPSAQQKFQSWNAYSTCSNTACASRIQAIDQVRPTGSRDDLFFMLAWPKSMILKARCVWDFGGCSAGPWEVWGSGSMEIPLKSGGVVWSMMFDSRRSQCLKLQLCCAAASDWNTYTQNQTFTMCLLPDFITWPLTLTIDTVAEMPCSCAGQSIFSR